MEVFGIVAAFLIVFSFLIGAYAMFRISEHYNREIRCIIEDRAEGVYIDEPVLPREEPRRVKRAAKTGDKAE